MIEFCWKLVEKVLGLIGGPLWNAFLRRRAKNLIRGSHGGPFSLLLARLDGDTDSGSLRETLRETIRREFSDAVQITAWPEVLRVGEGHQYDAERGAHETAQRWLKQTSCDLLVWGRIKGQNVLSLRFTIAEVGSGEAETHRLTETFDLPAGFLKQLGAALASRIALSSAPAADISGHYLVPLLRASAERLKPIVERLNPNFDADIRGSLLISYALIRTRIGEQSGTSADLQQAVAANGDALKEYSRERVPLDWAMTQNNLGIALATLGERESDTVRLEQAVVAFRDALKEFIRERVPLDWAMTQNNLGNALVSLGERESGTARLEDAVAAYREALKEYTRERVPLQWAATQNNLGAALQTLGARESGTVRLEEAVAAYRDALKERTRERGPLDWAMTQNNLGNALSTLGARESGTVRLEEAITAFRDALKEYARERVPLQWAATQNNLGAALHALSVRESGTMRLEEAVVAYRNALKEYTRERGPLDWATTQNNLGNTLQTLGARESGTARLEEAVASYREALSVYEPAGASHFIEIARRNLNRAEALLSERQNAAPTEAG